MIDRLTFQAVYIILQQFHTPFISSFPYFFIC